MAIEPVTATAVASGAVVKALDGLGTALTKNIGRFTKPVIDKAVVDLGLGFRNYLDASYNRCRFFKTILNQAQPMEVVPHYVHNTLSCGKKKITDDELINSLTKLKYVVVSGLAGSGKSMFMKYLTVAKFENTGGTIPLFIELRQINNISQKDLIEFVRAQCIAGGHSVSIDQFKLALSCGAFCIILDGFDELHHEFRDDIAKQILSIVRKYPDVPLIISSRQDDRFGGWAPFHVYNVDSLTKKQTLELINTLDYDSGVKRRFYREVKERLYDSHTSFLSSPLLTTIMLLTYEEFAEIPVKMHAFYSQAFDTLFQKHDASKEQYQRKIQTGLGKDDFKSTFAAFCAMSYLNQRFSFEEDDLKETAESAIKYVRQAKTDIPRSLNINNLISDLKEAVCLLQQDGLETAFVHRSFQEYFAALFATSLHGEKLRKVLDKYALRFGDSVISMAIDMARENVEQEWVVPTTQKIQASFFNDDQVTKTSERMRLMFDKIAIYRTGDHISPHFLQFNVEILGHLETLSRLYPERIGPNHVVGALRDGLENKIKSILNPDNMDKANYDIFEGAFLGINKNIKFNTMELTDDNDWWLNTIGLNQYFSKLKSGLEEIRKDISLRARKRRVILDEFL